MDSFINFLNHNSPSGNEQSAREWLYHNTKSYKSIELEKDVNGNIYGILNKRHDSFKIMIEGHIDEIGGQITNIDENGFIYFREVGGVDRKTLPSQRVMFTNGVYGIIGKKAIHLEDEEEQEKVYKIKELYIDCGFQSRDEALQKLEIGDYFTFAPNALVFQNDMICSKGIDDKVGAYIAFEVLKKLSEDKSFKTCVYAVGTTGEEIGVIASGATTIADNIKPDISISIDVNFASDAPNDDKNMLGDISLGKGIMIARNADTNPKLYDLFKRVNFDRQYQVTADTCASGGTNAAYIKCRNKGIATFAVGIPCRYMHTSGEMISYKDVTNAIELLVKFIKNISKHMILIP